MSFTLTPIFSDPLNVNANPLNPTNWTPSFPGTPQPLQISSNVCISTAVDLFCSEYYSGSPTPNDSYCSVKIATYTPNVGVELDLYIRSNPDLTHDYDFTVGDFNGNGFVLLRDDNSSTIFENNFLPLPVPGDVFTVGAVGTTIFCMKNGVVLGSVVNSTRASGFATLGLFVPSPLPLTDLAVTNFVMGSAAIPTSAAYSVPDCRVAPAGPNASRTVQGTKIYDVQTSSNHAVPGTDSRTAVPTDSRVASIIPQNSRTPGTFGPGE